mgnify:CR=1 FL=1
MSARHNIASFPVLEDFRCATQRAPREIKVVEWATPRCEWRVNIAPMSTTTTSAILAILRRWIIILIWTHVVDVLLHAPKSTWRPNRGRLVTSHRNKSRPVLPIPRTACTLPILLESNLKDCCCCCWTRLRWGCRWGGCQFDLAAGAAGWMEADQQWPHCLVLLLLLLLLLLVNDGAKAHGGIRSHHP